MFFIGKTGGYNRCKCYILGISKMVISLTNQQKYGIIVVEGDFSSFTAIFLIKIKK